MEELEIKKLIKNINSGDYSTARVVLKNVIEEKIQSRIREAMKDD